MMVVVTCTLAMSDSCAQETGEEEMSSLYQPSPLQQQTAPKAEVYDKTVGRE